VPKWNAEYVGRVAEGSPLNKRRSVFCKSFCRTLVSIASRRFSAVIGITAESTKETLR
jgi:hypothetical protein